MCRRKNYTHRVLIFLISVFFLLTHHAKIDFAMSSDQHFQEEKAKFDIQFKLYNGKTLPQLIPSVEGKITENEELLESTKFLFISALNKSNHTAFLTIDIYSANNKQLGLRHKLTLPPGHVNPQRSFELVDLGATLMETKDEDAILDYKIADVWYK